MHAKAPQSKHLRQEAEKMQLDRIDREILALLSKNARMSNKEVAGTVGLSASSTHERIRRLFDSGLIVGTYVAVDLDRLGLSLKALLFIQMSEHEKTNLDAFVHEVMQFAEVRSASMITGRYDAVVELVTRDTAHLHRIVVERFSSRPEVHRIETSIIFDQANQADLSALLTVTA